MAFSRTAGDGKAPNRRADKTSLRQPAGGGLLRDRALPPDPETCTNILLDGLFPTGPAAHEDYVPSARPPKAVACAADFEDVPRQPRELRTAAPRRSSAAAPPPAPPEPAEPPPLPEEAAAWESREKDLWLQSQGTFHPRRALGGDDGRRGRSLPTRGSVSVVAATCEAQQEQHRLLWECFEAQEFDSKELVVVETYHYSPSEFFTRLQWKDKRLVYVGIQRPFKRDFSTALRRNMGVHLASGEFVAHFDVRGLYAPQYLDCMIDRLCQGKKGSRPIAVTLSRRYTMDPWSGDLGVFSPLEWAQEKGLRETDAVVRKVLFGDAFSFVYRREAALELPFRECEVGAEVDFCTRIMDREGSTMVALLEDTRGVCLHTRSGGAGAQQPFEVRLAPQEEADALEVVNCEAFDTYMRAIVEPALNASQVPQEERRVHPENGKVYTLSEFREVCKGEFTPEEIEDYWKHQCKPMLNGSAEQAPASSRAAGKVEERHRRVAVEVAPPRHEDKKPKESKSLLMRLEAAWEEAMAEERARARNPFPFAEPAEPVGRAAAPSRQAPDGDALPGMAELLAQLDGEEDARGEPPPPSAAPAADPPRPPPEAPAADPPRLPPEAAPREPPPTEAAGAPAAAAEADDPPVPSMAQLLADLGDDEVLDAPAPAPSTAPPEVAEAAVPGMAELLEQLDGEEPTAAPVAGAGAGEEAEAAVPGMAELLARLDGEVGAGAEAPPVPGMEELLAQLDREAGAGEEVD